MDLVGGEALLLHQPDFVDEFLERVVVLGAGVGLHLVVVRAEDPVHGQVDGLAQGVPEAVIDGGSVGELALAAHLRRPLRSEGGEVEHALAAQGAPGVLEPAEVAPVGVPVAVGKRVVALDAAGGHDAGYPVGDAAARAARPEVVNADLLDGEVGKVARLHSHSLGCGEPRVGHG